MIIVFKWDNRYNLFPSNYPCNFISSFFFFISKDFIRIRVLHNGLWHIWTWNANGLRLGHFSDTLWAGFNALLYLCSWMKSEWVNASVEGEAYHFSGFFSSWTFLQPKYSIPKNSKEQRHNNRKFL